VVEAEEEGKGGEDGPAEYGAEDGPAEYGAEDGPAEYGAEDGPAEALASYWVDAENAVFSASADGARYVLALEEQLEEQPDKWPDKREEEREEEQPEVAGKIEEVPLRWDEVCDEQELWRRQVQEGGLRAGMMSMRGGTVGSLGATSSGDARSDASTSMNTQQGSAVVEKRAARSTEDARLAAIEARGAAEEVRYRYSPSPHAKGARSSQRAPHSQRERELPAFAASRSGSSSAAPLRPPLLGASI
jgi:hypothetical protein